MTPQTQNLIASFTGAAIGLAIEHNTPFALLYAGAGCVVGPWILNQIRQRFSAPTQNHQPPTQSGVPDYRL